MNIWYLIILTNLCAYLLYIFCCSYMCIIIWTFDTSITRLPHIAPLTAYHIILYFSSFILCLLSIALLQSFTSVFTLCCYYEISLISFTHYVVIMKSLLYRLHTIVWLWNLSYIVYTMLLACLCYLTRFITKLSAHMLSLLSSQLTCFIHLCVTYLLHRSASARKVNSK